MSARGSRLVLGGADGAIPVAISITSGDGRVEGTMIFRTASEAPETIRRVDGTTCEEVADALSLILVLTFDPHVLEAPPDGEPASRPAAPHGAPAPSPPRVESRAKSEPPSRTDLRWFTGAQATMAAVDHLPRGVVVFGELERGRARSQLAFRLSLAMTNANVDLDAHAARLSWATATPELCPFRLRSGALSLLPCAGVSVGVQSGVPTRGGEDGRSFTRPWVAPRAVLRGRAALGDRLGVEVQGMLDAPLTRHRYRFGQEIAFAVPTLFPSVSLGVVLELD